MVYVEQVKMEEVLVALEVEAAVADLLVMLLVVKQEAVKVVFLVEVAIHLMGQVLLQIVNVVVLVPMFLSSPLGSVDVTLDQEKNCYGIMTEQTCLFYQV